jgi:hypothetical protein
MRCATGWKAAREKLSGEWSNREAATRPSANIHLHISTHTSLLFPTCSSLQCSTTVRLAAACAPPSASTAMTSAMSNRGPRCT